MSAPQSQPDSLTRSAHVQPNASLTAPAGHTERPTGKYALHTYSEHYSACTYLLVYRNGLLLTQVRARDAAAALREARRQVATARRCGF